jgi:7-cyano-7-deazaguanine synthase
MPDTVVVFSGGLDSTTLLYDLHAQGRRVAALSVNYGQRHIRELEAATTLAAKLGVPHRIADLGGLRSLFGGSSLTDPSVPVPEGHYAEESMKATVVPNRNMLLLAAAGAWAIALRADSIAYAAHGGDHAIYPDCRPEFAEAMGAALRLADWHRLTLQRPYVDWTKGRIVRRGSEVGVPFADTWSCYVGGGKHCGRCGTCVERREAFQVAGIEDPTLYLA